MDFKVTKLQTDLLDETNFKACLEDSAFRSSRFLVVITQLLFKSKIAETEALVTRILSERLLPESDYIIGIARRLIRDVSAHTNAVAALGSDYEIETISRLTGKTSGSIPEHLTPQVPTGHYITVDNSIPVSLKGIGDYGLSAELKSKFTQSGFGREVYLRDIDSVVVARNCRISYMNSDAAVLVDELGHYQPLCSGRVAKVSSMTAFKRSKDVIKQAYVLPFPHSANNYYHSFCEMGYGLRFVNRIQADCPIIYGDDSFGIIDFFSDALGIAKNRFVKARTIEGATIEAAYIPDAGPFYWSTKFVEFFRSVYLKSGKSRALNSKPRRLVYVSRLGSSRSAEYETALVEKLASIGVSIVKMEVLSIREQIDIFAHADCVIGYHGAGFTNMMFCHNQVTLVEIFTENMLCADFQQRSRFVTSQYTPLLATDLSVFDDIVAILQSRGLLAERM